MLFRSPKDRKKMAVTDKNSKPAVTNFEVVERFKNYTHLKLRLETGRTHQIRVHMSYIGNPVAGDPLYGKEIKMLGGQCLHSKKISFSHPETGEEMTFETVLPEYFVNFLNTLEKIDD